MCYPNKGRYDYMKIDYNVTGAERKALVAAISEITGVQAKYLRVPSYAYQIGAYNVSKEGTITCDENIKDGTDAYLLRELAKKGFTTANAKDFEGNDGLSLAAFFRVFVKVQRQPSHSLRQNTNTGIHRCHLHCAALVYVFAGGRAAHKKAVGTACRTVLGSIPAPK